MSCMNSGLYIWHGSRSGVIWIEEEDEQKDLGGQERTGWGGMTNVCGVSVWIRHGETYRFFFFFLQWVDANHRNWSLWHKEGMKGRELIERAQGNFQGKGEREAS